MKRIIDGKRYDTKTAECIFEWDNGRYSSDFHYRSKTLYRTPKGAWFVHHDGGPMTDMAEPCGSNGKSGSEAIEVVSAEEARQFLEKHGGVKALETHFADQVEDA